MTEVRGVWAMFENLFEEFDVPNEIRPEYGDRDYKLICKLRDMINFIVDKRIAERSAIPENLQFQRQVICQKCGLIMNYTNNKVVCDRCSGAGK